MDPNAPPVAPDFSLKTRRSPRVAVAADTRLRSADLYDVEVRIRNISTCGFMAECAAPVQIGSFVLLDVPGVGRVHAQVRWQIGYTMGGMFLDPISLDRCEWTATRTQPSPRAA